MVLTAWLATGLFIGLLAFMGIWLAKSLTDVVLISVLSFGLFYGFRAVLLAAGLDVPSPDWLFTASTYRSVLTEALAAAALFVAGIIAGIVAVTRTSARGFAPFFVQRMPSTRRLLRATLLLTAGAVLISLVLLVMFGGPGALIASAKYDKSLAGFYVLRIIPAVGAMVSAAAFLDIRLRPGRGLTALFCLLCMVINGAAVFLWGSRSLLVLTLGMLALGLAQHRKRDSGPLLTRAVVAVVVGAVAVVAVAGALRQTRDTLTHGEVQDSYASSNTWRKVSLGTNAVYLDAAMLAYRDFPDDYELRNGVDFSNGVLGLVPRTVWEGKPAIAPGAWFRQVYQPGVVNGWPMGAPALWYLNFGWLGVPLGGLVSGLAIGMVAARQRRSPNSAFNSAGAVVCGVFVLGLGWGSQTPVDIAIWLVPLWLVARYLERPDQGESPPATPTDDTSPIVDDKLRTVSDPE